jgi:hypothetical protein
MTTLICPKCDREFVKRVSRQGWKERLMSVFYIYPFRCQLCGYRFRFIQWGIRYLRVYEDRREYERLAINFPVSVTGANVYCEGAIIDLSVGGCTVKLDTQLTTGDLCRLGINLPNDIVPLKVAAAVIRTVRGDELGIEFLKFHDNERERLQLFIRGLLVGRRDPTASPYTTIPAAFPGPVGESHLAL